MDAESASETLCFNYISMVDKVKKESRNSFESISAVVRVSLCIGLSKCYFDLSRMSIETDYTCDGGKT